MKTTKGWALKNSRGLVWKNRVMFSDPVKTALFKTRRHALQYLRNIDQAWGDTKPVRVEIFIKEIQDDNISAID